jgi:hypothetical protein
MIANPYTLGVIVCQPLKSLKERVFIFSEYLSHPLFLNFKPTQMMSLMVLLAKETRERSPHIKKELNK